MIEFLAKIGLIWGEVPTYLFVGSFCFAALKRKYFGWGIITILFSMVLASTLKQIFLIPLNPALGKFGYAFPSSHTLVAVCFWGGLCLRYANRYFALINIALFFFYGFSLNFFGYHNNFDITGAVVFAAIVLVFFERFYEAMESKRYHLSFLGFALAPLCIIMTLCDPLFLQKSYLIASSFAMIVFSASWYMGDKFVHIHDERSFFYGLLKGVICLLGAVLIFKVWTFFSPFSAQPFVAKIIEFSCYAFWIGLGCDLLFWPLKKFLK